MTAYRDPVVAFCPQHITNQKRNDMVEVLEQKEREDSISRKGNVNHMRPIHRGHWGVRCEVEVWPRAKPQSRGKALRQSPVETERIPPVLLSKEKKNHLSYYGFPPPKGWKNTCLVSACQRKRLEYMLLSLRFQVVEENTGNAVRGACGCVYDF